MLNDELERYWEAAYAEGKEGRTHDTKDGVAQRALSEIRNEVRRLIEASWQRGYTSGYNDGAQDGARSNDGNNAPPTAVAVD